MGRQPGRSPTPPLVPRLLAAAYCGDRIVCTQTDEQSDRLLFYKEPTPEGIGAGCA